MQQLTIIANVIAKEEYIDLVKTELLKLIEITRIEEGCINYDLHQDNEDLTHFTFYENWSSRELWQIHMANKHLADYIQATDGAVESFTVHEMTKIA